MSATPAPDDVLRLGGLTLEQFVGVTVALADGIALEAVLAQEGIAAAAWPPAQSAWRLAIAQAPDLQLRYVETTRAAEDALARPVTPVDRDPGAWAGLLATLMTSGASAKLLASYGMTMSDVARLGRAWTRRARDEPEVAKALAEAAGKAPPPLEIRCGPAQLRPFPWSPRRDVEVPAPGAAAAGTVSGRRRLLERVDGELPVMNDPDLYAALDVVLELVPEERARALALCGLSAEDERELHARWERRLERDPVARAAFSASTIDHRNALRRLLRGATPIARASG